MSRVLLGMSGGVDSSVALSMLLEQGYDVEGLTMSLFDKKKIFGIMSEEEAAKEIECARKVAEHFGVRHRVMDFSREFSCDVMEPFMEIYHEGKTPNPCVTCNKKIKFGTFLEYALENGFDYVATGHYVNRIYNEENDRYLLKRAFDEKKDQSYFLYGLKQHQIKHSLFPLGGIAKEEVRKIAAEKGIQVAEKKDSQDICFIKNGEYGEFIRKHSTRPVKAGNFVKKDGTIVGKHSGLINYTIGQRKGLGIALGKPMFVIDKDVEKNRVIIGENKDLFSRELSVSDLNWVISDVMGEREKILCKIRSTQNPQPATLINQGEGKAKVVFDEPQRAFSPGQSAVFYRGDILAGGGIILK